MHALVHCVPIYYLFSVLVVGAELHASVDVFKYGRKQNVPLLIDGVKVALG